MGISSCPNDTFIFGALYLGLLKPKGISLEFVMDDVETLNNMVLEGKLDVSKVSIAVLKYTKEYTLLRSGGAFSHEGPVVVSREEINISQETKVALPGKYTTAHLLFSKFHPEVKDKVFMRFDEIFSAVSEGLADAGVVIHEGRFIYEKLGFTLIEDLGEKWKKKTGLPIPLGGIVIKKSFRDVKKKLEDAIKDSLFFAYRFPEKIMPFVEKHAQHLDKEVIRKHIETYVNNFTFDVGKEGEEAVKALVLYNNG